jgi:hypothetical protein
MLWGSTLGYMSRKPYVLERVRFYHLRPPFFHPFTFAFCICVHGRAPRPFSPALCSHLGDLPVPSSLEFAFLFVFVLVFLFVFVLAFLFVFVLAFLFPFAFAFTTLTRVRAKPGPLTSSHLGSLFIYIVNF